MKALRSSNEGAPVPGPNQREGPSWPECFSEGNVVYVNRDHPLFQRESRKAATQTMHIARLVTQEISLMKETRSPRVAFSRQSQLLKDAFAEE